MIIPNILSGILAKLINAKAFSFCVTSACASSAHAIVDACLHIISGTADVVLAGGAEAAISKLAISGFNKADALSTRNDDPTHASRPYDIDRDGFVMGEGAGVLVLEELEHAKKRGARIYAEIIGYGISCDAFDIVRSTAEGACQSMKNALNSAHINPCDVDYLNPHGTSTPHGDKTEIKAIKMAFGNAAYELNISSTKSIIGHLLGAAGAVESIVCIKSIMDNIIHPTINLFNQDPECDLRCTPNVAIEKKVDITMSNSFGFGGQNATLIYKRFTG